MTAVAPVGGFCEKSRMSYMVKIKVFPDVVFCCRVRSCLRFRRSTILKTSLIIHQLKCNIKEITMSIYSAERNSGPSDSIKLVNSVYILIYYYVFKKGSAA
jgi:hypothetical protein